MKLLFLVLIYLVPGQSDPFEPLRNLESLCEARHPRAHLELTHGPAALGEREIPGVLVRCVVEEQGGGESQEPREPEEVPENPLFQDAGRHDENDIVECGVFCEMEEA